MNTDSLQSIAEMAITLLGVSGLVTVFLSRGDLHLIDKLRFIGIVSSGVIVAIFAFLPSWVAGSAPITPEVWQACSIGAIVFQLLTTPIVFVIAGREAVTLVREVVPLPLNVLIQLMIPATLVLHLMNAVSWPIEPNQVTYEVCLFLALLFGTLMFVSIVLFRPKTGT